MVTSSRFSESIERNMAERERLEQEAAEAAEQARQAEFETKRQLEAEEREQREANRIPFAYVLRKATGEVVMDGFADFSALDPDEFEVVIPDDGQVPENLTREDPRPISVKLRDAFIEGLAVVMGQLDGATLVDMAVLKAGLDEAARLLPPDKFVEGAIAKIEAFSGLPPEAEPVRAQLLALLGVEP